MVGKLKVREVIRELMTYNLDADFELIGNDGCVLPIDELNIGYRVDGGCDCAESERDIYVEKMKCTSVLLFLNMNYEK